MRFLCDEMLVRLARLLRAAGYDTVLSRGGAPDREIVSQARGEGRIILTRDRTLATLAGPDGLLVSGQGAMGEAQALTRALPIDWALAPFTRCVMDNAAVREASPEEIARMPESARGRPGPFRVCPDCGRLYWPGSHTRRIGERLAALERSAAGAIAGFGRTSV
jgi:uncharacterized protein with PIN domain